MDPILQQLLAADPVLAQQAGLPQPPVPSVTRPESVDPAVAASLGDVPRDPAGVPAPSVQPVPEPAPQGVLVSSGQSQQAWNPARERMVDQSASSQEQKRGLRGLQQANDRELQRYTADTADYRDRAAAVIEKQGDLAARRADDEAKAAQKQAGMAMDTARDMQTFTDAAWTRVQQSQADFQTQLAAVRGMRVNPTQWYTDRDTGQKVADALSSGVAMYWMASGKPAMAEVGKTILGNFDKQVQRNIDAQVENLRNQQQVSDGFLRAWQLASQNAVSEQDAKYRVHAMLLQAHKDQLVADIGAKYDSDQARAAAEQAAVELDRSIQNDLHKSTAESQKVNLQIAEVAAQNWRTQQQVSVQRDQIEEARLARSAEARAKRIEKLESLLVVDPETKERRYLANDETSKKIIDESAVAAENLQQTLEELDAAIRASGGRAVGGAKNLFQLQDSEDRVVSALAHRVAYQYARTLDPTSRTVTDKDYEANLAKGVPIAGLLDRSTGEEARAAIRQLAIKSHRNALGVYTKDFDPDTLPEGVSRYGARRPSQEGAMAQATAKPPTTTRLDKATKVFNDPSDREQAYVRPGDDDADRQWLAYASETGAKLDGFPVKDPSLNAVRQPNWAPEMSDLAMIMRDPSLPQADRVRARERLLQIQKLQTFGDKAKDAEDPGNVDAAYFAKWLLSQ